MALIQSKVNGVPTSHRVGCASIHLRSGGDRCSQQYIEMGRLKASNKGWHASWFYLKNEEAAPLPRFAGRLVEEAPTSWKFGPQAKEKKRLGSMLAAVLRLGAAGLTGSGVVGAYHARRVAPIMVRALSLYAMTPGVKLAGTVMSSEEIRDSEIRQWLKEAFEAPSPYPEFPTPDSRRCCQRPTPSSWYVLFDLASYLSFSFYF